MRTYWGYDLAFEDFGPSHTRDVVGFALRIQIVAHEPTVHLHDSTYSASVGAHVYESRGSVLTIRANLRNVRRELGHDCPSLARITQAL